MGINIKGLYQKLIAVLVVVSFLFSDISLWAQSASAQIQSLPKSTNAMSKGVRIPDTLGSIQDVHWSEGSERFVVLIQDAHAIQDAQSNIQQLIHYFQENYGIDMVAFEGAQGTLDNRLIKTFPDSEIVSKVMNQYLKNAEITGVEMASLSDGGFVQYVGIEDWELYEQNFFSYVHALKNQKRIQNELNVWKQALDSKRKTLYSEDMNRFHNMIYGFYEQKIDLLDLLKYLKEIPSVQNTLTTYTYLNSLIKLMDENEIVNNEEIRSEILSVSNHFYKSHFSKLEKKDQKELNQKLQALNTSSLAPGVFLKWLSDLKDHYRIPVEFSSTLIKTIKVMERFDVMRGSEVFDELNQVILAIEKELALSSDEQEMAALYRKTRFLDSWVRLEITKDEWMKFADQREGYQQLLEALGLEEAFETMLDFYQLALLRDDILFQNLVKQMRKADKNKSMLLLGGFHAQGIKQQLKDSGYSYVSIMPRINDLEGKDVYHKVMRGHLSYQEHISTTIQDAFLKDVAIQLTNHLNPSEYLSKLKQWRDEVIRSLANEGKVSKAKQYTRYIDPLFKNYYDLSQQDQKSNLNKEQILSEVQKVFQKTQEETAHTLWSRFESQLKSFELGLNQLERKDRNDPMQIQNLMETINALEPAALVQLAHPLNPDPSGSSNGLKSYFKGDRLDLSISAKSLGAEEVEFGEILEGFMQLDELMGTATVDQLTNPRFRREVEQLLESESGYFGKIMDMMTDNNTAFPVLMERAQDMLFDPTREEGIRMGMVSVPLAVANNIGKEYGIPGFPDILKGKINSAIQTVMSSFSAMVQSPNRPRSAYLGGRIILLDVPERHEFAVSLRLVIDQVILELKEEYGEDLRQVGNSEAQIQQFKTSLDDLPFYGSHARVYMPNIMPNQASRDPQFSVKNVMRTIRREEGRLLPELLDEGSDLVDQMAEYIAKDRFLSFRRNKLARAATFWTEEEDFARIEGYEEIDEEGPEPGARRFASDFLELLLVDAINKLNERLETLENVNIPGLRKIIDQWVYAQPNQTKPLSPEQLQAVKKKQVGVLGDNQIQSIKRSITAKHKRQDWLAELFNHFQQGRSKTIPPYNFHSEKLPRVVDFLEHIYSSDLSNSSYALKLKNALSAFSKKPNEKNLKFVQRAYRRYRLMMEEGLVLAYRDHRLQEAYKLFSVSEVVKADKKGLLKKWKKHVLSRHQGDNGWSDSQRELLDNESLRFDRLMNLVTPGFFMFKRPVGDEIGFLVFDDASGLYKMGFAEFNKGNAFFQENTPDPTDSVYHSILLDLLNSALGYSSSGEAQESPWKGLGFFENLNDTMLTSIQRLADEKKRETLARPYPTSEKVYDERERTILRMPTYIRIDEDSSPRYPHYAKSPSGDVYYRGRLGDEWKKQSHVQIRPNDRLWRRFTTQLSAARTIREKLVDPDLDDIQLLFDDLDDFNGMQKKDIERIGKVVTDTEIRTAFPEKDKKRTRVIQKRRKTDVDVEGQSLGVLDVEELEYELNEKVRDAKSILNDYARIHFDIKDAVSEEDYQKKWIVLFKQWYYQQLDKDPTRKRTPKIAYVIDERHFNTSIALIPGFPIEDSEVEELQSFVSGLANGSIEEVIGFEFVFGQRTDAFSAFRDRLQNLKEYLREKTVVNSEPLYWFGTSYLLEMLRGGSLKLNPELLDVEFQDDSGSLAKSETSIPVMTATVTPDGTPVLFKTYETDRFITDIGRDGQERKIVDVGVPGFVAAIQPDGKVDAIPTLKLPHTMKEEGLYVSKTREDAAGDRLSRREGMGYLKLKQPAVYQNTLDTWAGRIGSGEDYFYNNPVTELSDLSILTRANNGPLGVVIGVQKRFFERFNVHREDDGRLIQLDEKNSLSPVTTIANAFIGDISFFSRRDYDFFMQIASLFDIEMPKGVTIRVQDGDVVTELSSSNGASLGAITSYPFDVTKWHDELYKDLRSELYFLSVYDLPQFNIQRASSLEEYKKQWFQQFKTWYYEKLRDKDLIAPIEELGFDVPLLLRLIDSRSPNYSIVYDSAFPITTNDLKAVEEVVRQVQENRDLAFAIEDLLNYDRSEGDLVSIVVQKGSLLNEINRIRSTDEVDAVFWQGTSYFLEILQSRGLVQQGIGRSMTDQVIEGVYVEIAPEKAASWRLHEEQGVGYLKIFEPEQFKKAKAAADKDRDEGFGRSFYLPSVTSADDLSPTTIENQGALGVVIGLRKSFFQRGWQGDRGQLFDGAKPVTDIPIEAISEVIFYSDKDYETFQRVLKQQRVVIPPSVKQRISRNGVLEDLTVATAASLGSGVQLRLIDFSGTDISQLEKEGQARLDQINGVLGQAFFGLQRDLETLPSGQAVVNRIFEEDYLRGITSVLGDLNQIVDATFLLDQLKGAVARLIVIPNALASAVDSTVTPLSDEARVILQNPELFNELYQSQKGNALFADPTNVNWSQSYILDASFFPRVDDPRRERAELFVQQLIASGIRIAVPYKVGSPEEKFALELRKLIPEVMLVGYNDRPLGQRKFRSLKQPMVILPMGISVKLNRRSDWKDKGVVADPQATYPSMMNLADFVSLIKIVLHSDALKSQLKIDDETPFPQVTMEFLNSLVNLINDLAKTKKAQQLIARAA